MTIYNGVGHAFVNPKDHRSGMPQAVDVWKQVISFMNETVSSGKVLTRRAQDLRAMSKCKGSSWAWIWDHTKDVFQGKGHFSHLRHNNCNLNESPPATKRISTGNPRQVSSAGGSGDVLVRQSDRQEPGGSRIYQQDGRSVKPEEQ